MPKLRCVPSVENGYIYQRFYAEYIILTEYEQYDKIVEEANEDIDCILKNKQKNVYQIKYHNEFDNMSFTRTSELMKVLKDEWNKNDINKIYYCVYNKGKELSKECIDFFSQSPPSTIGQIMLLFLYENKCGEKNSKKYNNITKLSPQEIENIFLNVKGDIQKSFENEYNFFTNENNCKDYFSKLEFKQLPKWDDLNDEMEKVIKLHPRFKEQIDLFGIDEKNTNNKTINENKIFLVVSSIDKYIYNKLTQTMMNNVKSIEQRTLNISLIYTDIDNDVLKNINDVAKIKYNSNKEIIKNLTIDLTSSQNNNMKKNDALCEIKILLNEICDSPNVNYKETINYLTGTINENSNRNTPEILNYINQHLAVLIIKHRNIDNNFNADVGLANKIHYIISHNNTTPTRKYKQQFIDDLVNSEYIK